MLRKLIEGEEKISVIGLGYVGLPIAVSFSKKAQVIGFDINRSKIECYRSGIDVTKEVGNEVLAACNVDFTWDETRLRDAKFHIVAVPTPLSSHNRPDLSLLEHASGLLGRNLTKGSVVIYESTVYPGVTEEVCLPVLERESGLTGGSDFKVGYSPERINPGDSEHRLETIVKVVSGMDEETLNTAAEVYALVAGAGVFRAESIRVAEAAKVIENCQRDINIAFMNELSIIFNKMGIDTKAVLEAAETKWNFLKFVPGLVGGHCIGVDPYYLTYKAEELGYNSQIILSGRRINDSMGGYIAQCLIKDMINADIPVKGATAAILGFTFKENCPDTRNTKVYDILTALKEYGVNPVVVDPVADAEEAKREYGIELMSMKDVGDVDAVVLAVAHEEFLNLPTERLTGLFRNAPNNKKIIYDIKGLLNRRPYETAGYRYWRL